MVRSLLAIPLLSGVFAMAAAAQTASPVAAGQPPDNYRGPDTYGLCMYVAGDTTYYGNTFYVSSYFRFKAQQAIREYATAHAGGVAVKAAQCFWSYKEADLANRKEMDRRLIGMPGRSASLVDTGWVYNPADATNASTAANTSPASAGTARPTTTSGGVGTGAASGAAASNPTTTRAATNATATNSATSVKGNAQQSLAGARTSTTSSVNGGVNSAIGGVSTGVGGALSGLSSRFSSRKAKPAATAPAPTSNPASNQASASASQPNPQPNMTTAPTSASPSSADNAGPTMSYAPAPESTAKPLATGPVEGLVADVAGKELVINVGSEAGVAPGTKLAVMHAQRVVKDPVTGKVLRTVEAQIGVLDITSVDTESAVGTFTGSPAPIVGDKVRTKPK